MFGTLGGPELFLIFVVALIVFGPRKLPEIGRSLGKMMAEFRKASNEFRATIESEVEAEKMRDAMRIDAPRIEAGTPAAGPAASTAWAPHPEPPQPGQPTAEAGAGSGETSGDATKAPPQTVSRVPEARPAELEPKAAAPEPTPIEPK
jgi:Tat protein translocase TatB subunit